MDIVRYMILRDWIIPGIIIIFFIIVCIIEYVIEKSKFKKRK